MRTTQSSTQSTTRSSRFARTRRPSSRGRRFVALAGLGVLALGCAEPAAPSAAATPNAIIIIGGRVLGVLNVQLRAIGNPDEAPVSSVYGHVQLKVYDTGDGGFVVEWKGQLFNPQCETVVGGGLFGIGDPEERLLIDLLPDEQRIDCGENFLAGAAGISADLAATLVTDPEDFPEDLVVAFFTEAGGVIAGWPYCVSAPDMPVACRRGATR